MQLLRYCSFVGDIHRAWTIAVIIAAALGITILGLQAGVDLSALDTGHGAYSAMLRSALQSF